MATILTPELRETLEDALIEEIDGRGTFAVGSASYLATLHATPNGTELEGHELEDVLELWPSLLEV
jgi:hypothetical protein